MKQEQSVLVTGGAGYIGSHAVLALRDAGRDVAVLDNLSTGFRWLVPDDVPFYQGDVADAGLLAKIFAERRMGAGRGAIMHFAGSIIVPESVSDPLKYYDNNTSKSRALIAAAVEAVVPHFIFSSTATVYGEPEVRPLSEDDPVQPVNPYGMSKAMTERILADTSAAHAINHAVLRYFNVAGADPQGRSGQSGEGATHLIKVAVECATGKRDHVAVFGNDYPTPDGTGMRDYIHVSDLAAAHLAALDALVAEPDRSLTMNVGYGRGFSVLEVLDAVDRVVGRSLPRRQEPRRPGDVASLVSDPSRIRGTTDWQPRHDDLERIVADALAWEEKLKTRRADPGDSAQLEYEQPA